MSSSIKCGCGKIFSNKRSLAVHRSQSCVLTIDKREVFSCPHCPCEYKHQFSLNRHLPVCPNKPKDLNNQETIQPAIQEQIISNVSCRENSFSDINHSTINNSPTTNNDNSLHNTLNDHSVNHNHYYINLYPDLNHNRVHNLFATKLTPEYISQGETGLYEFIFCEIFTDPTNPNKTAIMCVNYKEEIFHYGH